MVAVVERFGIRENVVESVRKYGVYSVGAFAGFGVSQFTAEFITKYAKLSGATATVVKVITRLGWWFIFIWLSAMMPSPALTAFMAGAGIGSFAGVFMDIFNTMYPGGFSSMASAAVASLGNPRPKPIGFVSEEGEKIVVK